MIFWSPDTRLARAPVDPERSLGSLLLVKVMAQSIRAPGGFIFRAALERLLVREGSKAGLLSA